MPQIRDWAKAACCFARSASPVIQPWFQTIPWLQAKVSPATVVCG